MLTKLQAVEDKLHSNESIQDFLKTHSIYDVIKMINKTTKQQTRIKIKKFFYKLNDSPQYKQFLLAGLWEDAQKKGEFQKYLKSDYCQQYFQLLDKKTSDLIAILDTNPNITSSLFSLVYSPTYGIKMIKVISRFYSEYSNHECLFTQQIKNQLQKGLQCNDTVVQMRFVQIVANIAIHGGKSFQFVKQALQKSLNIYETQDILLKLNIVQIISILGHGIETSQLLKGHKVWATVQKDALNQQQQFYVRKSLLILLVNMTALQQYQITPKFTKSTIQFLGKCFKSQGQQLEAGLELTGHLLKSGEGAKILIQNSEIFNLYLKISRSPQDRIKNLFVESLIDLTDKKTGKKTKQIVINILNCIGNPNLSNQLSHNINSTNFMSGGITAFCQWFVNLLKLPFQDLQLKLIQLFINLLQYNEICEELFENQQTTKYLLRPIAKGNTTKVLKGSKNNLVHALFEKGSKQWKNNKLGTYAVMIQKQLSKQKMQMEISMEAA